MILLIWKTRKEMPVLITGGTSFIGIVLAHRLVEGRRRRVI
jgi:nucleoside-diphosphate-sugar epimerase